MKSSEVRLYNVMFPIWLLWIFPQVFFLTLPVNLAVDAAVLFGALLALRRTDRRTIMKAVILRIWGYGYAADAAGVLWMLFGQSLFEKLMLGNTPGSGYYVSLFDPLTHPASAAWALLGIAISGVLIFGLDWAVLESHTDLPSKAGKQVALALAIITAPWTFLLPSSWLYF